MNTLIVSFDDLSGEKSVLAGGKGGSLAKLYQAGFPVPPGFVILPAAFDGEGMKPEAWAEVDQQLTALRLLDPDMCFAVRSSALSEDSASASFAGEFESVLNMKTNDQIQRAVHQVYHSRNNERVKAYSLAKGMDTAHQIAVVVQQLVKAEVSGVLFTANPVTGQRNQAMITATWGLGEALVSGVVTPDTLEVEKSTCRVIRRRIADKRTMTVLRENDTEEQPVPDQARQLAVLNDAQVSQLVPLGNEVEALYGMPMDIEWVLAGNKIWLVQARPITSLPVVEELPPTNWKLPKGQYAAMRNNIVELMPNPLTPLFDTLGRKAINTSLRRLIAQFLNNPDVLPGEFILTVNGYAYNNGSVNPAKAMGMVLDIGGILKRMFTGAVERWTEVGRPHYISTIEQLQANLWRELSSSQLIRESGKLFETIIDAYGALISGVIPAAWISEALFTKFYNALIKRKGDPAAQIFLLGFDSAPIRAEKDLFNLACWASARPTLAAHLGHTPTAQLVTQIKNGGSSDVDHLDWVEWQRLFRIHLQHFGHMIYDLDFANPLPLDDPAQLLAVCQMFINNQGDDPCARQMAAIEKRNKAEQAILAREKGWRLKQFSKYLRMAQRYAPLREDGLADVGLGYPLLREILLELGKRLCGVGVIETANDIFWLTQEEVERSAARMDEMEAPESLAKLVPQRKVAWRAAKQVTPPMMLPQMKVLGVDLAGLKSRRARKQKGTTIKGVATSPGSVTGPACVLNGPEDFPKMKTGDVLVAAITTPAWTPLFARAAAVVTDVGGPLSHGSIVAREYGIPAVLGTGVATQRIRDGQTITVDGSRGLVLLEVG